MTMQPQGKFSVAFVCVHNSCRSQMAEGYLKRLAGDLFEVYSAGTEDYGKVKPKAIEVMQEVGIDISGHYPKRLKAIPEKIDILVTMGCNVQCVSLPNRYSEDWGLSDPSDGSLDDFRATRDLIKQKCLDLIERVESGQLNLHSVLQTDKNAVSTREPNVSGEINSPADDDQRTVEMTASEYDDFIASINQKANNSLGVLLGIGFGFVGATAWAIISKLTGYNIGFIAIFIGFLVGQGFVNAGRSTKPIMGVIAAIIALLSTLLGNLAFAFLQIADYHSMNVIDLVINFDYHYLLNLIIDMHTAFDIIFYTLAASAAYKRSFINKHKLNISIVPDRYASQDGILK